MLALLLAIELSVPSYAQHLVDEVVAQTPGLLVIALHVSPPGMTSCPIVASNIGRIGKAADDDDMRVINTGRNNLEVAHGGTRFEVELPMHDVAGETVGAIGLVFPYKPGASKAALEKKAVAIRDRLAARTLNAASLVEPYPFDPLATTRTHAQKLVDEMLRRHPELRLLAVHAKLPKGHADVVIASSFGGIGKRTDLLHVDKATELPLLDAQGATIGGLLIAPPPAEAIRDELRKQILSLEKLTELDP